MRLGEYTATLKKGSKVNKIYNGDEVKLRHCHRFEINLSKYEELESAGFVISGKNPELKVCEFMELIDHSFFIGTQAPPEFDSQFLKPQSLFYELIKSCIIN